MVWIFDRAQRVRSAADHARRIAEALRARRCDPDVFGDPRARAAIDARIRAADARHRGLCPRREAGRHVVARIEMSA